MKSYKLSNVLYNFPKSRQIKLEGKSDSFETNQYKKKKEWVIYNWLKTMKLGVSFLIRFMQKF